MFDRFKPLLLLHRDLQRIAVCLEFFVRAEARKQGILWNGGKPIRDDGVEPELFHTVPAEIAELRAKEQAHWQEHGEE